MLLIVITLLVLHSPDGREIDINPDEIVSMFEPGKGSHEKAGCQINTSDGKFQSVVEECSAVIKMIKEREHGMDTHSQSGDWACYFAQTIPNRARMHRSWRVSPAALYCRTWTV